jgi:hypothetical protein
MTRRALSAAEATTTVDTINLVLDDPACDHPMDRRFIFGLASYSVCGVCETLIPYP